MCVYASQEMSINGISILNSLFNRAELFKQFLKKTLRKTLVYHNLLGQLLGKDAIVTKCLQTTHKNRKYINEAHDNTHRSDILHALVRRN